MSDNRPTREECEVILSDLRRFQNPWTIEILNHANHRWSDFCRDAPLTLVDAEKRESSLKAEYPDGKFRVVPWFNSNQKQIVAALLDENANLKRDMGLIGAACVAGDLYEAYHQFYMAVVKDLNLPAEEQSRLTQVAIDAAMESTASEGEPKA